MLVILFGSNIEGMKWNHFMTILLLYPYFKINSWIYRGILGVLVKKIIKSNSIPSHSSQFWGEWKLEVLRELREWVFPPTHSIPSHLNSQTREWIFHSLRQNSQTRGREEYSKNILFIPFHSLLLSGAWGLGELGFSIWRYGLLLSIVCNFLRRKRWLLHNGRTLTTSPMAGGWWLVAKGFWCGSVGLEGFYTGNFGSGF